MIFWNKYESNKTSQSIKASQYKSIQGIMFSINTCINDVLYVTLLFVIIVCLSQMIMISYPNDIIIFIITVLCLIYTILYTMFIFTGDENLGNYIK